MKKLIIVYYGGLKNHLIFNDFIIKNHDIIDCIIKVPISAQKNGKKNYIAYKNLFRSSISFIFFIFMITYFSNFFLSFFTNIHSVAKLKKIKFIKEKDFNINIIKKNKLDPESIILFSGSTILDKKTINYFNSYILGFHEGELPYMKGSALYLWYFMKTEFKFAYSTIQTIDEKLDNGRPLLFSEKIKINSCNSVFDLWLKLSCSYRTQLGQIQNKIRDNSDFNFQKSPTQYMKNTYMLNFPNRSDIKLLKRKKIILFNFEDFKKILNIFFP
tara:strand:+ start:1149 stop:1964 length:816 start_codon:yes stop_codon:yes gene_type:complete